MKAFINRAATVVLTVLLTLVAVFAQGNSQRLKLLIAGYVGDVPIAQSQGHLLVDVQDLARLTNGSISYEGGRVVLTLPCCATPKQSEEKVDKSHFSRAFTRAAIEATGSIREWGGVLMTTVENGYPVGGSMAGNVMLAYQGRAADNVALAAAAASTEADYAGAELLRSEYNNVQAWSDEFIKARRSMSAVNLTTSPAGPMGDPEVRKLFDCGQSLARMFAAGRLEEDVACR